MIYRRKNKRDGITYWFIRYDLPDGRRKKEKAGTTKQDAKDRLIQRKSEILKGEFLDPKSRGATFAEFASRFLDDYGDTKLSAYYRQTLTKTHAVMRFFGKMQLDRIAESDLERFRRERSKTVGPSTVRKNLTLLGTMFRMAKKWGAVRLNSAADVEKPAEPEGTGRPLTEDQWGKVRQRLRPYPDLQLADLALATVSRLREITALEWGDVDLDRKYAVIQQRKGRRPRPKRVALSQSAIAIIER